MNMLEAKQLLPIIKALAEGKKVQFRHRVGSKWRDVDDLSFNLEHTHYRIKPEPKEVWVHEYPSGDSYHHLTKEASERAAGEFCTVTHYREVIED